MEVMPTPESEITKMNLDKLTLELVQPCREQKIQKRNWRNRLLTSYNVSSRKPKNEIGWMDLRVSSTVPRTENSKTKVDKQSLKFVDTPAAENQKSKMDEYTLGLAQPFPVETNC